MKAFSLLSALLLTLVPMSLRAGEPIKPGVTVEAHQAVKFISDFYKELKSARADLALTFTQEIPGQPKQESKMKALVAAERPRLFKLQIEGEQGGVSVVCDGQSVWTYLPELKQFTVDSAPMTHEILLRYHDTLPKAMSQLGPLGELLRKDPAALILEGVDVLKVAGRENIGGTECVWLHGEQPDMDWDAWFAKGEQPVLRRFKFSPIKGMLAQIPEEARGKLQGVQIHVTVDYDWQLNAPAAAGAFAFEPPAGAQKVAHFFAPEPEEKAGSAAEGGEALKGKPAPDFTLSTLDGGKMHLADLKGKVVVLDFWATWCGPCVAALPMVNEAASARKDKGVVFFAVNQQEAPDEIRAFLQKQKLDAPVALDSEGVAAKLYQVRGIPQTVIVGKDGNIASVHIGFSPKLKETLGKELDEILAK